MTIELVDASTTRVHWNGTMHDTVFSEMWYLDRTEIESVEKTKYPIDISHSLIAKIWDIGAIEDFDEYLISLYVDTPVASPPPQKNIEIYYLNCEQDVCSCYK